MSAVSHAFPPGLAPPPDRAPPLLALLLSPPDNFFELMPRAAFEQPVFRPRGMGRAMVMVSDPEGVRRVLVDEVANYPKHRMSDELFSAMFGEGLLGISGDKWRRHRKTMAPAFDPRSVGGYASVMASAARIWAESWADLPDGARIDIAEAMKAVTLQIICETMFSSDAPELTALAGGALGFSQEAFNFGLLDLMPVIGPIRRAGKRDAIHAQFSRFDAAIYRMIAEREADLDGAPRDLLTRLIAAKDPDDAGGFTASEVRDEVVTIFEAGHETTAVALTWTWYLLSQHPAEEAKLHAELDAVLGERSPTADDLPRLRYTRMVIEEAMRLFPPAPTLSGREAQADDTICGVPIKAGERVMVSPWVIHRHRRLWDDPERFDPERFSAERGAGRPRFAYMPFGAGPRVCIGASFAMAEATLILAELARRFQPLLAPDQDVRLRGRITLSPANGLAMRLNRRAR